MGEHLKKHGITPPEYYNGEKITTTEPRTLPGLEDIPTITPGRASRTPSVSLDSPPSVTKLRNIRTRTPGHSPSPSPRGRPVLLRDDRTRTPGQSPTSNPRGKPEFEDIFSRGV